MTSGKYRTPMAFKIYTRTGDAGETALYGGKRVAKDIDRIEAYGTVDELNAHLGLLLSFLDDARALPDTAIRLGTSLRATLTKVQSQLFTVGAQLATPPPEEGASAKTTTVVPIGDADIELLEQRIDALEAGLPDLTSFVLPAGPVPATQAHVARTIARRAERRVVTLAHGAPVDEAVGRYLNRLSDYLFVAARAIVYAYGAADKPWVPGK